MTRRTLVLLFVTALAVRLLFVFVVSTRYPVNMHGAEMKRVAANIAAGKGFSAPFGTGDAPTAHFGPVVPYIWAAVFRVAGTDSTQSVVIIRGLQAVASAVAVVLLALIAARIRDRWTALPQATPLVVGSVLALWPESIFMLTNTWYYQWQEAALALMVLLGLRWIDRPSYRTAAAAGVGAGVLALINPSSTILFALILAMPILTSRASIIRRRLPQALVGGAISLAVILPWTARNYSTFGEFIPVRGNMNLELIQSHHPDASPLQHYNSFHPAVRRDARALYDSLGERAFMDWAGDQFASYVRENPGITLDRTARRIGLFWFTNAFDSYRWRPEMPRWWQVCCGFRKATRLATILCAIVPLAVVLFFLLRGAYRLLPYRILFLGFALLLPLPYYVTAPGDSKSMIIRPWLALVAVLGILATRRVRRSLSSASATGT